MLPLQPSVLSQSPINLKWQLSDLQDALNPKEEQGETNLPPLQIPVNQLLLQQHLQLIRDQDMLPQKEQMKNFAKFIIDGEKMDPTALPLGNAP